MTDSKIPSRASKAILEIRKKISDSAKNDEWQTEKCIDSSTDLILKFLILSSRLDVSISVSRHLLHTSFLFC